MVGGEICKGSVLCNNYTDQTIITNDGGNTFRHLSTFPALLRGHCAVFIDENKLMVIGGYKFDKGTGQGTSFDKTYFLDLTSNVWTTGPSLPTGDGTGRAYHTCNVVTNCNNKKEVVVVAGWRTKTSSEPIQIVQLVDIFDVESEKWSSGIPNCSNMWRLARVDGKIFTKKRERISKNQGIAPEVL